MSTIDDTADRAERRQRERNETEGRKTADRLWSYSDAVFAVIVTIMVLQLKPPKSAQFSALFALWPTVISYVVSYVFIAIIWINHHYLTRFIRTPTLGLMWTNFIHLLLVSLLPFTTAWMAQTRLRIARRRSLLALTLFAMATFAAAFEPWLGFALVCSALVLHIKPDVGSGRAASNKSGDARAARWFPFKKA
jgi:uncharacterized membrane protein